MLRRLLPLLALMFAALPAAAQERVLNVYNWSDYIDPYAVQRFTRETGIRVRYDVYDSLETLEGRLSAGRSGYDIIVPTSEPTFARLLRAGALRPIDRERIPNWRNLDPVLMDRVTFSDLFTLSGDQGGRALFARYPVQWVPWHDSAILQDIDTPEDYQRLLET